MSTPTETDSYKKLQSDVNATKSMLFAERDKIVDFEIEYPDKSKRTLHFKRLRSTEWDHVVSEINLLGDLTKANKDQLDKLYAIMCLALGYTSADGLNAADWVKLDDKLTVETAYFKLMDISGVSKAAIENLSWFHDQWRGKNEGGNMPANEPVPVPTSGSAGG